MGHDRMDVVEFAKEYLGIELTPYQKEVVEILYPVRLRTLAELKQARKRAALKEMAEYAIQSGVKISFVVPSGERDHKILSAPDFLEYLEAERQKKIEEFKENCPG